MNKVIYVLMALVATSSTAMAGGVLHVEIDANGEMHTIDAEIGDDGSAVLLIDGQPVQAPGVPELPALPTLP